MTKNAGKYKIAKEAKVGETIKCAWCGTQFVKKQYSQAFCCDDCRNNYHNKQDPKRRAAARARLDKLDEKRWRKKMIDYYGYVPHEEIDPEADDHVSEQLDIYS